MKVDSLDELKAAFAAWRKSKKHAREPMPDEGGPARVTIPFVFQSAR